MQKYNLWFSIFSCLYFGLMRYFSDNNIDFTGLRFTVELLTIPMMILVLVSTFLAFRFLKSNKKISLITIFFIIVTLLFVFYKRV